MNLEPGGLIAWLVVGLVAGWLAGQFMKGGGYGLVGDVVIGIVGAFVGGLLFTLLLPGSSAGLLGSIVVAFLWWRPWNVSTPTLPQVPIDITLPQVPTDINIRGDINVNPPSSTAP